MTTDAQQPPPTPEPSQCSFHNSWPGFCAAPGCKWPNDACRMAWGDPKSQQPEAPPADDDPPLGLVPTLHNTADNYIVDKPALAGLLQEAAARIESDAERIRALEAALRGVIREADRDTDAFIRARALIATPDSRLANRGSAVSRRDEHREQFAARYRNDCAEGMGHVELAECPMCGWLEWRCVDRAKPAGVSVMPMWELHECDRCMTTYINLGLTP